MMAGLLLGLDIGTSSIKALLAEAKGEAKILATVTVEYRHPVSQPKPDWSEQHPEDWWDGCQKAIAAICKQAGKKPADVIAVGLSGQMHGSVFLDRSGEVIRPALLWNDQRTAEQCHRIEQLAGGRAELIRMVKNPALTGYTAPKILWLREKEPKHFARLAHLLLPKDYIRFRLSGVYATEVSDAAGTLLLDVDQRQWSLPLLSKLNLDPALLPSVAESSAVTARISQLAAKQTGLRQDTPIVGGAGDQPAGAVGMGVVAPGLVSATLGTSGVIFAHAEAPVANDAGTLQSFCHAAEGQWCVFGCMLSAGGSFQWLRNTLGQAEMAAARSKKTDPYTLLIEQAAHVPVGSEGLFFLPYLTGERCPYPDPRARAGWIGLTARHTRAHLIRSVLEGISFGLKDQVELMRSSGVKVRQVRVSGGGARSAWWSQLLADVFNAEVVLTNSTEGGAYGVALLAGVGAGVFPSVSAICAKAIKITKRYKPNPKLAAGYNKLHTVYRELYADLKDTFPKMG